MEIFGEIFEDFWILFAAFVRAVRVVRAQALYKESEVEDFSHSCLDCQGRYIAGFQEERKKKERKKEFFSTRPVGFAAGKKSYENC